MSKRERCCMTGRFGLGRNSSLQKETGSGGCCGPGVDMGRLGLARSG
jgi:hypothetical protein